MNSSIGVIGLSVMGANLARNLERNGYQVSLYNRTQEKTDKFISKYTSSNFIPTFDLDCFVKSLSNTRIIFLMVKAGLAVDELIDQLTPLLNKGDILVDLGNTYFKDTKIRQDRVEKNGQLYVGCGISGGEDGALYGPSLMPSGTEAAWMTLKPILEKISAKTSDNFSCVTWIGPEGSGHFVKMIHNGLEYADMQMIADSYLILRDYLGLAPGAIADIYQNWNSGNLKGYLMEITEKIFRKKDDLSDDYLVNKIQDTAHQKGTGIWTNMTALELSTSLSTIASAVDARFISSNRTERAENSKIYPQNIQKFSGNTDDFLKKLEKTIYFAKIINYIQGLNLMEKASAEFGWNLDYQAILKIWRAGCIIRSKILEDLIVAYKENKKLIQTKYLSSILLDCVGDTRVVVSKMLELGLPVPTFVSALTYFDEVRSQSLPTNLIQAQRDFFGAHLYERIDLPGQHHTRWEAH